MNGISINIAETRYTHSKSSRLMCMWKGICLDFSIFSCSEDLSYWRWGIKPWANNSLDLKPVFNFSWDQEQSRLHFKKINYFILAIFKFKSSLKYLVIIIKWNYSPKQTSNSFPINLIILQNMLKYYNQTWLFHDLPSTLLNIKESVVGILDSTVTETTQTKLYKGSSKQRKYV